MTRGDNIHDLSSLFFRVEPRELGEGLARFGSYADVRHLVARASAASAVQCVTALCPLSERGYARSIA